MINLMNSKILKINKANKPAFVCYIYNLYF